MIQTALVSSCLLGLPSRYDGSDNYSQEVVDYLHQQQLTPIPICPEQLAGLPTPREKCWFCRGEGQQVLEGNGAICNESGEEVTKQFRHGAELACRIARYSAAKLAILKQRSPSCGSRVVHRNGQLVDGLGVTAAALKQAGLKILAEDDLAGERPEK